MRLIVISLLLFFLAQPVLAIDAPILISPSNNSTISSIPTFSWQAVSGGTGYNILIDDEPTVTSPYAKTPYYPTNPSYSPQTLNPGTYYWKVKAKDSSGNWGSFSSIWSFTLQSTVSSPSPTPTPTPASTPAPSSTSAGSTSSSSSSSFTISNTPSQVNSDQSFTVSVSLSSPSSPNANFYLKGAFKKADSSNYFGLTKVSGSWIKNGGAYSNQYPITTDSSGNWSGNLDVQPDSEDSGFIGTGDYIFKVGKYTSSGSGPTWSNESTIKIVAVESSNLETTAVSPASNDSPPTTNPSTAPSAKSKVITSSQSKSSNTLVYHSASVAAATTSASPPNIAVRVRQSSNFIAWIGAGLILTGIGLFAYIYLRSRGLHETISNLFRKRN